MGLLPTDELEKAELIRAARATTPEELRKHLSALLRSSVDRYGGANRALVTDLDGRLIAACGPNTSQWSAGEAALNAQVIEVVARKRLLFGDVAGWDVQLLIFHKKRAVGVLALSAPQGQLNREGLTERLPIFASMLGELLGEHHLVDHHASLTSISLDDELTGLPFLSTATVPETGWAAAVDLRELRHYNDDKGSQAGDRAILRLVQAFSEASREISEEDHRDLPTLYRGEGAVIVLTSECPDPLYLTRIAMRAKVIFAEDTSGLRFLAGIAQLDEDGVVRAQRTLSANKAPTYAATVSRVVMVA